MPRSCPARTYHANGWVAQLAYMLPMRAAAVRRGAARDRRARRGDRPQRHGADHADRRSESVVREYTAVVSYYLRQHPLKAQLAGEPLHGDRGQDRDRCRCHISRTISAATSHLSSGVTMRSSILLSPCLSVAACVKGNPIDVDTFVEQRRHARDRRLRLHVHDARGRRGADGRATDAFGTGLRRRSRSTSASSAIRRPRWSRSGAPSTRSRARASCATASARTSAPIELTTTVAAASSSAIKATGTTRLSRPPGAPVRPVAGHDVQLSGRRYGSAGSSTLLAGLHVPHRARHHREPGCRGRVRRSSATSRGGYDVWQQLIAQLQPRSPDLILFSGDAVTVGITQDEWEDFFARAEPLFATSR